MCNVLCVVMVILPYSSILTMITVFLCCCHAVGILCKEAQDYWEHNVGSEAGSDFQREIEVVNNTMSL